MRSTLHRRLALIGAILGANLLPLRSEAQSISEMERRVDALVIQRDSATAALAAVRRRVPAPRVHPDTVTILDGAFRILTTAEFLPLVREAATQADSFIRTRAGVRSAELRGTTFAVYTDSVRRSQHGIVVSPRVNGREVNEIYLFASEKALSRFFIDQAHWLIGTRDLPSVAAWLAGGLPIDTTTNSVWRALRLELVSSPASVARRCYAGDLRSCKVTLGLEVDEDPATAWYDSAARRLMVEKVERSGRFDRASVAACMAGDDAECTTIIRTHPMLTQWADPPGSGQARVALAQHAFAMGGPGALQRLVGRPDSVTSALSAIANAPLDSVVAQWQRRAHDGGIESEIATPIVVATAIGWFVIMGGLSLRSSRWR